MRLALTKRQTDVVLLIGERKSYAEIGEKLGICTATVITHVKMVNAKLPAEFSHLPPKSAILQYLTTLG